MSLRPSILGLLPVQLEAALDGGISAAEARRVIGQVVGRGDPDLDRMRLPVARPLRARLREALDFELPRIVERVPDPVDDSLRYLLEAADGARFEVVRIGLHKADHYSLCLSSQVGCAMACAFCATGRLGLGRHLSAGEIVGSYLAVRAECPGRVSGAVFMGQGEPFHNYEAVLAAAGVLSHPCGGRIDQKAITISTVGLVPQIRRFTAEGHRHRLIVSLTSAIPERRLELLPVPGRVPLADLRAALAEHASQTGTRITVAWVLLGGVNDSLEEAQALGAFLEGIPARINLIDVNDPRPEGFRRASPEERARFVDSLRALGVPVVRRYSVGLASNSACGMLAARSSLGA